MGDLSTTDTSENGDPQAVAQAEESGINESSSRNDLRRIHTMETFSWQGYSMQQQNQATREAIRAEQQNQTQNHAQINLAQSAAYPAPYTQESSTWGRSHREQPAAQQQWNTGEWASDSTWMPTGSRSQAPSNGVPVDMPGQNFRAAQAGYLHPNVGNAEGLSKFQPSWYQGAPVEDSVQTAFRPQEQPEVPAKQQQQPNLVPVPVPVMLGPNGTMIPVPMGNGMGLPQGLNGLQQALAPQAPQGIPSLSQTDMGQQMVFLRPNGGAAPGMQLFSFVNVPPQQQEAPKKQVKEAHTESTSTFGDDITLMLRNLPNKINQTKLLSRLQSYRNKIDFLYLPTDFENKCNLGYAFINFVDGAAAARFKAEFNDKKLPGCRRSHKVLAVQPARVQGVSANVRRFRNSSVMGVLSEEEKPMLFKDGVQIPFPMPDGPLPPVGPRYPREGEQSSA